MPPRRSPTAKKRSRSTAAPSPDLTELKAAEEELRRAKELGAITNAAYLLRKLDSMRGDPQAAGLVDIILEEVWRANRTITALLDTAKVRPSRLRPSAPWPIVIEAVAGHNVPANVHVIDEAPSLPAVLIDAEQVREALGNIVQNALEAMPEGGSLRLSGDSDDQWVRVHVADTGAGVPAKLASRLFEPLVTTKPLGFGLGLATAQLLVKSQHGAISFTSEPGRGARFTVTLPVATPGPHARCG